MTARRRRRPSGGPTIPERARRERGQEQLRARVSAAVHGAYEREAERRGIALAALVREQLERAAWAREGGLRELLTHATPAELIEREQRELRAFAEAEAEEELVAQLILAADLQEMRDEDARDLRELAQRRGVTVSALVAELVRDAS